MHLLGNMLYLWIFGNNIEDAMGHAKFVVFYILSGILAALSHALTDPSSQIPMVGASGAISAVLGAYLLLFPRAHVLVLLPAIGMTRVAAGVVLGAGAFAGAYEFTYNAAPPELLDTSVSTATTMLLTVGIGFLAASVIAPVERAGAHLPPKQPRTTSPETARLDEIMEHAQ